MIEIVTKYSVEEMLLNPDNYIGDEEDIVLLKVFGKNFESPVMLMVGVEDESDDDENDDRYYFVEEDNEVSIYHHCTKEDLLSTYKTLLNKLVKEAEE